MKSTIDWSWHCLEICLTTDDVRQLHGLFGGPVASSPHQAPAVVEYQLPSSLVPRLYCHQLASLSVSTRSGGGQNSCGHSARLDAHPVLELPRMASWSNAVGGKGGVR